VHDQLDVVYPVACRVSEPSFALGFGSRESPQPVAIRQELQNGRDNAPGCRHLDQFPSQKYEGSRMAHSLVTLLS
jgi:hypothetical protein